MPPTGNRQAPLDFIEFFQKSSIEFNEKIFECYKKGQSITQISNELSLTRHKVFKVIKEHKECTKTSNTFSMRLWKQRKERSKIRPSYGFCMFEGQIVKDPKEYPHLQLILNLWKQGMDISSIVRELEKKKVKSRTGKSWSYNVIKSLIQRNSDNRLNSIGEPIKANIIQINKKVTCSP